jgi:predicted acyl esterase
MSHDTAGSRSETSDGMRIDWQVPVPMPDGTLLRADVFRPLENGRYPVILSHGVYAKGLPFNGPIYQMQWNKLVAKDPSVLQGSTNKYQAWEVTDPERWVPAGYAVVRVDSRGAGWSPGGGGPQAASPGGDHRLGGVQRPVPRFPIPRGDPERVQPSLAAHPDQPGPVRPG